MEFTSRQLRALLAVADRRSFSRASEMLYMTPSGVSVLIRELESQLGFRMFDRTTRSVSLTGHGAALVPVIRRVLAELEGTAAALGESAKETGQSVSLGAAEPAPSTPDEASPEVTPAI